MGTEPKVRTKKSTTPSGKGTPGRAPGGTLPKKNEFNVILIGALIVTVLVFFLFFRSPVPEEKVEAQIADVPETAMPDVSGLEKRISELEVLFSRLASSSGGLNTGNKSGGLWELDQRVTRLERSLTLKLDAVQEQLSKLENRVAAVKKASVSTAKAVSMVPEPVKKPVKKVVASPETIPVKKRTVAAKKPVKKKANTFHIVQKGETLWSISQKYKTTVAKIRQLNNLSDQDKIYLGSRIIVK